MSELFAYQRIIQREAVSPEALANVVFEALGALEKKAPRLDGLEVFLGSDPESEYALRLRAEVGGRRSTPDRFVLRDQVERLEAKNRRLERYLARKAAALDALLEAADLVTHWHDTMFNGDAGKCEGMVVSAESVRGLWSAIESAKKAAEGGA